MQREHFESAGRFSAIEWRTEAEMKFLISLFLAAAQLTLVPFFVLLSQNHVHQSSAMQLANDPNVTIAYKTTAMN